MNKPANTTKSKSSRPPDSQRYTLYNSLANYFVLVMFVLFPLFVNLTFDGSFPFLHFDRGYYGIRHQKYYLFLILAAVTVIGEVCLLLTEGIEKTKNKYDLTSRDKILKKFSFTDWSMLALVLTCAISTIFSAYKEMAFFGEIYVGSATHGRNNGLLLMLVYCAVYFIVSRAFRFREHIFVALAVTSAVVCFIAVLNCFYIDPLNMFDLFKNDETVSRDFLTTIGNKNMFSTYICVTLPVSLTMSVHAQKLATRVVCLVSVAFGTAAAVVCDSDSAVLGLAAFFAVFLVVYSKHISQLKRFFLGVTVVLLSLKLMYFIMTLTGAEHKPLEAFPFKLTQSGATFVVLGAAVVITAALYLLDYKKPGLRVPKAVPVVIAALFIAGVAALLGLVIYFSCFDTEKDLGSFNRLLRFNEAWGTHRGIMWIDSMKIFGDASFFEKLFGSGPESFYFKFEPYFKDLYQYGDGSTDAAHNEYIQYLINIGIVGLCSYLAFTGGALKRAFKAAKLNPLALVFASAVVAYMAQAVVNIALPIGTPLFIIFIALCENAARQAEDNSVSEK